MAAIKCLSPKVRDMLVEILEELEVDATILKTLKEMDSCEDAIMEWESGAARHAPQDSSTPREKTKRPPSAYQQHTGECMRGGHKTMAECAALWKAKKGRS